ncbi:MAG: pseudouridine synthase [Candidatus Peregrinibacteria bacterium]|nr:pseudouridine synthase [Candidatus Peregrinibacteria bacterium]
MLERLQKILSARGIASRRKAEEYIEAGLVKVNGKPAILGQKADPEKDTIEVDGKVLEARKEMLYYLLNKPVGVITSNVDSFTGLLVDSKANKRINESTNKRAPTVRELLPKNLRGKIFPVGRLDKDSEGLLLLTNDGVLAYRLTHPKFDHEKEYEVTVTKDIREGALKKLAEGMVILGSQTKRAKVRRLAPNVFRIALTEGKNRQIRRMCEKVGAPVKTLKRVRIMTLEDSALKPGKLRPLTEQERSALLHSVAL